jgi:hypothetical protein
MLYRAELWRAGTPILAVNYSSKSPGGRVTHPHQAVRRLLNTLSTQRLMIDYGEVYVLNDEGQIWKYQIKKYSNNKYGSEQVYKEYQLLPRHLRNEVFAGNKTIREVLS